MAKCRLIATWVAVVGSVCGINSAWSSSALCQEATASRAETYARFNDLCKEHFGAEKESEVRAKFGEKLKLVVGDVWSYVSERSAVIAWESNLPAKTCVEFGETSGYGENTSPTERYFYLHVHYLTGLRPGTTYHYRLVAVDERGDKHLSEDLVFTTKAMSDAVRIPADLTGPPYVLDRANATYLVTEDVTSDSTALNIAADGITLDLGGHTVTYDNKAGTTDPTANERLYGWHAAQGPCGIRTADRRAGITIVNGTIRQGEGNGASRPAAYNPIFMRRPRDTELAGVTVEYAGSQVTGIFVNNAYEGVHVHHNVVVDKGTELYNRHRGVDGIYFGVGREVDTISKCHHNLIKRARHRGLTVSSNTDIYGNEIYVDSYATNSYGIMYYSSRDPIHHVSLHGNRIFGTGYHPIGIGAGFHANDIKVYGNFIQMQGMEREERWRGGVGGGDPTDQLHPVNGVRLQKGPQENIEYRDNTIVVKGRGDGCMMRGVWLAPMGQMRNVVVRDNVVKVIAQDQMAEGHAIAAVGADNANPDEKIALIGNTIVSNLCHVRFGDNYGHGGKYSFVSNTFSKIGNDPRYRTIRLGWQGWKYETFGHVFIDTKFEGGAGYDSVSFDGAHRGRYDFSVGWQLEIKGDRGAKISVRDRDGIEVFSGQIPAEGRITIPLVQYVRNRDGQTVKTPHTIAVGADGKPKTAVATMDQSRQIDLAEILD
ncbi:MAG: fibronectin type III domain-containing protein [Planctomycetes bacterium]|nr:fibronectin type III domain-containing protein [Planctomycetota bacterium]MBL7040343.1 fibronectin type III domain-containing protein [Pirellulaceae bacterium]